MDIYWYGQACFKIKGKNASVVVDPYDPEFVGLKSPKELEADIVLQTHGHKDHSNIKLVSGSPVVLTGAGEYEIKGVSVVGVQSFHDDSKGEQRGKNTIFNISLDGLNIVHLGDLGHVLTEGQIAEVGNCDILMVPVGGVFTVDAKKAIEIVTQLEPRMIIPMHYKVPGIKFELDDVDAFLKEMGAEAVVPQTKLTITKEKLPEEPHVVVLNRS